MKRLFLALAFLILAAPSALAIDVTISGDSFPGYNYAGSTARLRIYPSQTFTASDSVTVPGGTTAGQTTGFFYTVNCTVASNVLTCPSVTLKSTTDALVGRDTTYTVVLFDAGGTKRNFFPLSNFWLSHTNGATTTWAVIAQYNLAATRPPAAGSYTTQQTDAAIAAALGSGYTAAAFRHTAVAYSATPAFDCGTYSSFSITLTGNVTSSTAPCSPTAGRELTVIVAQDSTGNRAFVWPVNFTGAPSVDLRASSVTAATFRYDGSTWRFKSKSTEEDGGYALYCDGTGNVHHGHYFPTGTAIGNQFYYDFIIKPDSDANGYVISDGFGGGHAMLIGPSCSGGVCGITGNVWNVVGGSMVSISSNDTFPSGAWTHVAVGGYGSDVRIWINGVPSSITSFPGVRGSPGGGAGSGNLYVCGSDHSMYKGYIAFLRMFEGWSPSQYGASAFTPAERLNCTLREQGAATADVFREANLCADYTVPSGIGPDLGSGFYGRKHSWAVFNNASGSPATNPGEEPSAYPRANWRYDPTLPFNRHGSRPFVTTTAATPGAVPSGAEVFDSFNRTDTNYWLGNTPSLGSTEGGSLGPQVWNTGNSAFGVINGEAYMAAAPTIGWATAGVQSANHSAEVTVERVGTGKNGVIWRGNLSNDFLYAGYIFSGGQDRVLIARFSGGVLSAIITEVITPPTWTSIKGQCVGTSCAVYLNGSGTPLHSWTEGSLLTGTRVGIGAYIGNAFSRFDNFAAYHL